MENMSDKDSERRATAELHFKNKNQQDKVRDDFVCPETASSLLWHAMIGKQIYTYQLCYHNLCFAHGLTYFFFLPLLFPMLLFA